MIKNKARYAFLLWQLTIATKRILKLFETYILRFQSFKPLFAALRTCYTTS